MKLTSKKNFVSVLAIIMVILSVCTCFCSCENSTSAELTRDENTTEADNIQEETLISDSASDTTSEEQSESLTDWYSSDYSFDDFDENCCGHDGIMVVITNEASLLFKQYTPEDFPEIDCIRVVDCSSAIAEKMQNSEQLMQEKRATFHQLLYLELGIKTAYNVVYSCHALMERSDVQAAEPNYSVILTIYPNDYQIEEWRYQYGFNLDGIMITMTNEASLQFKQYTGADFGNETWSVIDCSTAKAEKLQKNEQLMQDEGANFHQLLFLRFNRVMEPEAILELIETIKTLDGVEWAEPNYIYEVTSTTPNDTY